MMYTPLAKYNKNNVPNIDEEGLKLDLHTFLHETGHLLGLYNYYASDDSYCHPAGCSTMMNQNICDLDSYSKMILVMQQVQNIQLLSNQKLKFM